MYQDKTLTCKDCGQEFVFTAGEQEFYAEKGFQNEPTRCKACRIARKNSRPANGEAHLRAVWRSDPRAFHPEERPTHLLQRVLCFPPCFPLLIDEISPAPFGAGLFLFTGNCVKPYRLSLCAYFPSLRSRVIIRFSRQEESA